MQFDALGKRANTAFAEMSRGTQNLTVSWETMCRVVTTQAVVRSLSMMRDAFSEATEQSINFTNRAAEIHTIAEGSLGTIDNIKTQVANLASTYGVSLKDMSEATYQTLSSQIASGQDVYTFLENATAMSKAGVTSLATSVNLLSGTLNAYKLDASESNRISNEFFKTIELGKVRAEELAASIGTVAPMAAELGVRTGELDAAWATLTLSGLKSANAATQLRSAMSALIKPSQEAKAALAHMGFGGGDEAVAALGLKGTFDALKAATDGSATAMGKLFPNVRALSAAMTLSGSDRFAKNLQEIDGAATNLVDSKALEIMATDAATVQREWNKLVIAASRGFGDSIVTMAANFSRLTGGADTLINVTHTLTPVIEMGTVAMGLWGAKALFTNEKIRGVAGSVDLLSKSIIAAGVAMSVGNFLGEGAFNLSQRKFDALAKANEDDLRLFKSKQAQEEVAQEKLDQICIQSTLKRATAQTKAYQAEVDRVRDLNEMMVAATKGSVDRIIQERQRQFDDLKHRVDNSEKLIEASQERVKSIRAGRDDRAFNTKIEGFDDPTKAAMLAVHAQEIASKASADMAKANKPHELEAALREWEKARSTAEHAMSLAGNNSGAKFQAGNALDSIESRQIDAEQRLQKSTADHKPALEAQLMIQSQILSVLKEQGRVIEKNISLYDKGVPVQKEQLASRLAELQTAMKSFPGLDVTVNVKKIQDQLDAALTKYRGSLPLDADKLGKITGKPVSTGYQVGNALTDAGKQFADLRKAGDDALAAVVKMQRLRDEIVQANVDADGLWRKLAGGITTRPGMQSGIKEHESALAAFRADLEKTSWSTKITDEDIARLMAQLTKLRDSATGGPWNLLTNVGEAETVTEFSKALAKLKEMQSLQKQLQNNPSQQPGRATKRRELEQFFNNLPGATEGRPSGDDLFRKLPGAVDSAEKMKTSLLAVPDFSGLAANLGNAAAAMERLAAASMQIDTSQVDTSQVDMAAARGGMAFLAGGGQPRGTDTIRAMLSPGEFVMNSKSAGKWYSQLVAMNAGVQPSYRDQGGTTINTTIGDINVNGAKTNEATGRTVAAAIRRELRRGTSTL